MTLMLKTAIFSHDTLATPMMKRHHTKFIHRWFNSWEDVVQMKIWWNFEPLAWPHPLAQHINAILSQDNPGYDDVPSNQSLAGKGSVIQKIQQFYIDYMTTSLHCDLDLGDSKATFLHDTGLWWCITIPYMVINSSVVQKFDSKMLGGSEDITWTIIHWHFDPLLWPWPLTQQSIFFSQDTLAWGDVS